MRTHLLSLASVLALTVAGASASQAASFSPLSKGIAGTATNSLIVRVHSADAARDTLARRGFYDIRDERTDSLPYSFIACKRGARYHIHVSWYGELEQVDEVGQCYDRDQQSEYRRPHRSHYYGGQGSRRWSRDSY